MKVDSCIIERAGLRLVMEYISLYTKKKRWTCRLRSFSPWSRPSTGKSCTRRVVQSLPPTPAKTPALARVCHVVFNTCFAGILFLTLYLVIAFYCISVAWWCACLTGTCAGAWARNSACWRWRNRSVVLRCSRCLA